MAPAAVVALVTVAVAGVAAARQVAAAARAVRAARVSFIVLRSVCVPVHGAPARGRRSGTTIWEIHEQY
ncbi:hypothetical protein GCM10012278_81100 [Nonomuraea glycinis]|uniref:Secreted protein n=1 Tax=Nonomuraea glycinis TaxID=2047744 RepID=A0A918AEE1_9ACTN|nr:hypothetical protein GCM10012278_81100 [Nonomuraea glycinis]